MVPGQGWSRTAPGRDGPGQGRSGAGMVRGRDGPAHPRVGMVRDRDGPGQGWSGTGTVRGRDGPAQSRTGTVPPVFSALPMAPLEFTPCPALGGRAPAPLPPHVLGRCCRPRSSPPGHPGLAQNPGTDFGEEEEEEEEGAVGGRAVCSRDTCRAPRWVLLCRDSTAFGLGSAFPHFPCLR